MPVPRTTQEIEPVLDIDMSIPSRYVTVRLHIGCQLEALPGSRRTGGVPDGGMAGLASRLTELTENIVFTLIMDLTEVMEFTFSR